MLAVYLLFSVACFFTIHEHYFMERMQFLREPRKGECFHEFFTYLYDSEYNTFLNQYQDASLQDTFQMTIDYEAGQMISFGEKNEAEDQSVLDLFPPMRFCKAASKKSRRYLCSGGFIDRKGITMDHPFTGWLLENAYLLNRYFQRQLQQIVHCLCYGYAENIIRECNEIRQQLMSLPECHGVDVGSLPQMGRNDFWYADAD